MIRYALCGAAAFALIASPAYAQGAKPSSGRNEQARGMADWSRHELRVRTLQEYHQGVTADQLSLPL